MKFGLEIEFASTADRYLFRNDSFETGTDSTASYGMMEGLELRSYTFEVFPKKDLQSILNKIKNHDSRITVGCGTHIHFSGKQFDLYQLRNDLLKRTRNWSQRNIWCRDESSWKYKVVRTVEADSYHYEARIFNASLNFRAICQYFKILLECFRCQGFNYSIPDLV